MDRPSANHKIFIFYLEHLNLGIESTDWEIKILLKSCYQILDDSPARRDDYISITKSTKFPLAFCSTRRVEEKPVADRPLEI